MFGMNSKINTKDTKPFKSMKKTFEKGILCKTDIEIGDRLTLEIFAFSSHNQKFMLLNIKRL